jgi:hypothetical protein
MASGYAAEAKNATAGQAQERRMGLRGKTETIEFPDGLTNRLGSILVRLPVDGAEPEDNSAYFRGPRKHSTECSFEQPPQYALTLHYQVQVVAHGLLLIRPGQISNDALFRGKLFFVAKSLPSHRSRRAARFPPALARS